MSSPTQHTTPHKVGGGDPLFQAVKQHDHDVSRPKDPVVKEIYDKHARLMEHERSAVVGVGHGMWYFDDMIGEAVEHPTPVTAAHGGASIGDTPLTEEQIIHKETTKELKDRHIDY